jgi:hypothetical protein
MYSGVTSSNATNGSETASVDTVREVALNLLQGLLALL